MERMNKFTLLRAGIATSSVKIYPIKEKLLDFGKKLDKLLHYFTHQFYLTTTLKRYSNINWVNPSLESATEFATSWRFYATVTVLSRFGQHHKFLFDKYKPLIDKYLQT